MNTPLRHVDFIAARSPDRPDCFVAIAGPDAPTLVAIHGISRNAAELATRFAQHPAFRHVNIVAPLFEAGRFGQYQQLLARSAGETAADTALFALLADLAAQQFIAPGKVLLFGFSGGAQMAHRIAMLHPGRVSRLCAAAAGWYLLPDTALPYPYGLGDACPAPAGDAFLDIPTTVLVGTRDTRIDASVRQDALIITHQGSNRLRRARVWVRMLADRCAARGKPANASLHTLDAAGHDFGLCARDAGLLDHAATALLA